MEEPHRSCDRCDLKLSHFIEKVQPSQNCHKCGRYAFQESEPSYLYLITHPELKLHKVGIGAIGKDKNRLQSFVAQGWIVAGLWHENSNETTFRYETKFFTHLKEMIESSPTLGIEATGKWVGMWSESIDAEKISLQIVLEMIAKSRI